MSLKPLKDRVIVKQLPAEGKTAGGILIPDNAKEKPNRGTAIAAGPGTADDPMVVKPGDIVIYGKYSGIEIEEDGELLIILKQDEIFAVIEQDETPSETN